MSIQKGNLSIKNKMKIKQSEIGSIIQGLACSSGTAELGAIEVKILHNQTINGIYDQVNQILNTKDIKLLIKQNKIKSVNETKINKLKLTCNRKVR